MGELLVWPAVFAICVVTGVPLAMALGLAALAYLLMVGESSVIPGILFNSVNSFLMLAVPLFTLAGALMESSGMATRLFDFTGALLGRVRGGMGHSVLGASVIFGGISGSAAADAAALGPMSVNALEREGYPRAYSAALVAAGSSLCILIPPSVIMIIYAVEAEVSIAAALLAGGVPGVLAGVALLIGHYIMARKNGWGRSRKVTVAEVAHRAGRAAFALLTPAVILGGFLSGYFTPTEASGIAVLYTFIVGVVIYREQSMSEVWALLVSSARTSATVLFIIAMASLSTYVFVSSGVSGHVTEFLLSASSGSAVVLMTLIAVSVLIIGCFLEGIAAVILLTPALLPAAMALEVDPLHFGVVLIAGLAVGLITPPMGMSIFVVSSVTGESVSSVARASLPFIGVLVVNLAVLVVVPVLSLGPVHVLLE